jgi:hypothetical protein
MSGQLVLRQRIGRSDGRQSDKRMSRRANKRRTRRRRTARKLLVMLAGSHLASYEVHAEASGLVEWAQVWRHFGIRIPRRFWRELGRVT